MGFTNDHRPSSGGYTGREKTRMVDMTAVSAAHEKIYQHVLEQFKPGHGVIPAEKSNKLFTPPDQVSVDQREIYRTVQADFRESLQAMTLAATLLTASGGVLPTSVNPDPRNEGLENLVQMWTASRRHISRIMHDELGLSPTLPHMHALMERVQDALAREVPKGRPAGS
ncbi:MAG: hypothetical protein K2Q01_00385 [Rickettsiales bacterium]|nr:hypothetical protein [Rickettsiales bacterium]